MPISPNERISELQITTGKFHGKLTESNSLASALQVQPHMFNTIAYASTKKYMMQQLTRVAGRMSSVGIGNAEYEWRIETEYVKTCKIVGAPNPAPTATSRIGIGFSEFTVPLDDSYFAVGDVVKFPCNILARIQRDPIQVGSSFVYGMVIVGSNPNTFIPASEFAIGNELSWVDTLFEEMSKGGSMKSATGMKLRNQLSTHRYSYGCTGSAASDVMYIDFYGDKGGKTSLWMDRMEYQYMQQWQRIEEIGLWWGQYNKTAQGEILLPGTNGRPVRSGAGILQQISAQNTWSYSRLSEDYLRSFVNHLQLNNPDTEGTSITLVTGLGGKDLFDRALKDSFKSTINTTDLDYIVDVKGRHLSYGKYFTQYVGLCGTTINLMHNPQFDDKKLHTALDPVSGYPLESYRMVALDLSKREGQDNLQMVYKSGNGVDRQFVMWHTAGSLGPNGAPGGKTTALKARMASNNMDGYEVHFLSETGIKLLNPMSCGQLIYVR